MKKIIAYLLAFSAAVMLTACGGSSSSSSDSASEPTLLEILTSGDPLALIDALGDLLPITDIITNPSGTFLTIAGETFKAVQNGDVLSLIPVDPVTLVPNGNPIQLLQPILMDGDVIGLIQGAGLDALGNVIPENLAFLLTSQDLIDQFLGGALTPQDLLGMLTGIITLPGGDGSTIIEITLLDGTIISVDGSGIQLLGLDLGDLLGLLGLL